MLAQQSVYGTYLVPFAFPLFIHSLVGLVVEFCLKAQVHRASSGMIRVRVALIRLLGIGLLKNVY